MTYTYRNKTDQKFWLPGVGEVGPKEEIETDIRINNPNFELIETPKKDEKKEQEKPKEKNNQ